METAQDIVVEPEKDVEAGFSTFLGAAPEMPTFSDDELSMALDRQWRRRTVKLFRKAEARSERASDSIDD